MSRRWTTSTSRVVSGAPCATAARPPTRRKSVPLAASRASNVVRLCGGEAMAELQDGRGHAVVPAKALLRRERRERVEQGLVSHGGVGAWSVCRSGEGHRGDSNRTRRQLKSGSGCNEVPGPPGRASRARARPRRGRGALLQDEVLSGCDGREELEELLHGWHASALLVGWTCRFPFPRAVERTGSGSGRPSL